MEDSLKKIELDKGGVLKIPENISYISKWCFQNRIDIKKVVIPGTVKYIDRCAFSSCSNLNEVVFEEGIYEIGENAFSNCSKLKLVKLPESVISIGRNCFLDCKELEIAYLPGVCLIPEYAFGKCTNLREFQGKKVIIIKSGAFFECNCLNKIIISKPELIFKDAFWKTPISKEYFDIAKFVV